MNVLLLPVIVFCLITCNTALLVLMIVTIRPGRRRCFSPGTIVARSDNSLIAISKVKPGDALRTVDSRGRRTVDIVMSTCESNERTRFVHITTESGCSIEVTADHYVVVAHMNRWKPADEVVVGDMLLILHLAGGMILDSVVSISHTEHANACNIWMQKTPYVCVNDGVVATSCCRLAKGMDWLAPTLAIPMAYARAISTTAVHDFSKNDWHLKNANPAITLHEFLNLE